MNEVPPEEPGPGPSENGRPAAPSRRLTWGALAVTLAVLVYYAAPLWGRFENTPGTGDGGWTWFMLGVDRTSIVEHHQLPFWNPYYCGGAPHFGSPQSGSLSPFSIFSLLFGVPIGHRISYSVAFVAALLCVRAYARTLGLSDFASIVAGAGYAVCGAFAQHFGGGHWCWIPFAFYPLMLRSLHLVLAGRKDHLVWGALPITFTIFHWPIYPMFYALMLVPIYGLYLGLARLGPTRDWRRLGQAMAASLGMVALGVALGAVRLLPVVAYTSAHPRIVKDRDYTWPWELFEMYGLRHTARVFGHQYVWPEFGNYLGLVGLALVFAGAWVVVRRRRALWPVLAGVVTFCVFQLGNLIPLPWWILRHLPVFNHLRVPSRFTIVAGMFMCVLIGVAVDTWASPALTAWRESSRRARRTAVFVSGLALAFLVDAAQFNRLQWIQNFAGPPRKLDHAAEFHQVPGNASLQYLYPPANQGTLNCFEETPIPISPALRTDLPSQEYLQDASLGSVRRVHWSPNRIDLDVNTTRPTTVIVNQNFGPGWRAQGGTLVSEDGLLAARVPAGRSAVTFSYLPPLLIPGLAISLVAALAAAAYVVVVRRRPLRA
jgi:hypothetical protein